MAASSPACGPSTSRTRAWSPIRARGHTFKAKIDVLESMGSEFYAYFVGRVREGVGERARGAGPGRRRGRPARTRTRAARSWRGSMPTAGVRQGQEAELWFDSQHLQLFDLDSGGACSPRRAADQGAGAAAVPQRRLTSTPNPRSTGLRAGCAARLPARAPPRRRRAARGQAARRARRRRDDPALRGGGRGARVRQRAPRRAAGRRARLIVGTVDRARDFDRRFRPTSGRVRSRWERRSPPRAAGRAPPSIDVLRIGEIHFVRDGHHRVSVAHALGRDIDAYVTEVVTRVGADRTITLADLPLKTHERVFFERVPLAEEARSGSRCPIRGTTGRWPRASRRGASAPPGPARGPRSR